MSLPSQARDLAQRSLGCVGLSVFAHLGILIALVLVPRAKHLKTPSSTEYITERSSTSSAREKLSEVILADNDDQGAIVLPPAQKSISASASAKFSVVKVARAAAPKIAMQKESEVQVKDSEETQSEEEVPEPAVATQDDLPESLSPVIAEELEAEIAPKTPLETLPVVESKAASIAAQPLIEKPAPAAVAPITTAQKTAPTQAPKNSGLVQGGSAVNGVPTSGTGVSQGQQGPLIVDASLRQPVNKTLPQYSQQDRLLRREGLVVVVALVKSDGSVGDVRVERSSGTRDMDLASVNAFKKWRFVPGREILVRNPFHYSLKGDEQVNYARLRR